MEARVPRAVRRARERAEAARVRGRGPGPAGAPPARDGRALRAALLVGAAASLTYLNALGGAFVSDAMKLIVENRALLRSTEWLAWFGRDFYWGSQLQDVTLYRPLTLLSFLLQLRTTGPAPFAFLLGNLLLHAAVSVLVLRLGTRLVGPRAALVGALVFAVHPLHAEAVAWVMGRSELLAALFALVACLGWLRVMRRDEASPGWLGAGTGAAYLAALFSKEHVALLPVWFGLAWLLERRGRSGRVAAAVGLASAAGFALFLLLRAQALTREPVWALTIGLYNPAAVVPAPTRWLTATAVVGRYLLLFLWPGRLTLDYSYAEIVASSGIGPLEVVGLVALVGLLGAIALAARAAPGLALALALAPISFVLVSNFPFPIGTIMAERLAYLPSVGLSLAVGWVLARLPLPAALGRWLLPAPPAPVSDAGAGGGRVGRTGAAGWAVAGVLVVLILALSARTVVRNRDWRDSATLATASWRASPRSAVAQSTMATIERLRGDAARAEALAREALRIYPDNPNALIILAETHVLRKEWEPAAELYGKALAWVPRSAEVRNNLGIALARTGRRAEGEAELREAIRLAPGFAEPRVVLGGLLLETRRPGEALQQFQAAVRLNPRDAGALYGVARAALDLGDRSAAETYARRAAGAGFRVPEAFWRFLGVTP